MDAWVKFNTERITKKEKEIEGINNSVPNLAGEIDQAKKSISNIESRISEK